MTLVFKYQEDRFIMGSIQPAKPGDLEPDAVRAHVLAESRLRLVSTTIAPFSFLS
jgi:hypothetical protein